MEIEREVLAQNTSLFGTEHEQMLIAASNLALRLVRYGLKTEAEQLPPRHAGHGSVRARSDSHAYAECTWEHARIRFGSAMSDQDKPRVFSLSFIDAHRACAASHTNVRVDQRPRLERPLAIHPLHLPPPHMLTSEHTGQPNSAFKYFSRHSCDTPGHPLEYCKLDGRQTQL